MISRRRFLVTGSLAVASTAVVRQIKSQPADLSTWAGVREQFDLSPEFTHLGLFYIASHPRPVRQAIDSYRRKLDSNPFLTVERSMFEKPEDRLPTKACNAIASYMKQTDVVQRLLDKHKIIASTTPYAISYARVAFGIQNTEQEVEKALRAVRSLA